MATPAENQQLPIHRWYRFPAAFSHTLVATALKHLDYNQRLPLLDPFAGIGTSVVTSAMLGREAIGIEAHPYLHWIMKTKCEWRVRPDSLRKSVQDVLRKADAYAPPSRADASGEMDVVRRCFAGEALAELVALREAIDGGPSWHRAHLRLALVNALPHCADVYIRSPYVSYQRRRSAPGRPVEEFGQQALQMADDLSAVRDLEGSSAPTCILGHCRSVMDQMASESIGICVTSPPYLNNLDYAEITRLDTAFLGLHRDWAELGTVVRDRLMTCATTQVSRNERPPWERMENTVGQAAPDVLADAKKKIGRLREERGARNRAKSFDLLVGHYLTEMTEILRSLHRVMSEDAPVVLAIGDSALYGVYLPTDVYIAAIALGIGFSEAKIEKLRDRGGKWKGLTHRHSLRLRESVVILRK